MIIFSKKNDVFAFLKECLKPFTWLLFGQTMISLLWALDISLRPYIVKTILDAISILPKDGILQGIALPVFLYLFSLLVVSVCYRVYDWIIFTRNPRIKKKIISYVFDHLLDHSSDFFQNNLSGNLVNKINDLAQSVPLLTTTVIDRLLAITFALFIAVFTTWQIQPVFALMLIIWISAIISVSLYFAKNMKKLSMQASENWSLVSGKVMDSILNIASVRLFIGKKVETQRLNTALQKAVESDQNAGWLLLKVYSFYGVSFLILQVTSLVMLIFGFKQGIISVGDFSFILSINIALSEQLFSVTQDFSLFAENFGKINQALQSLSAAHEIKDKEDALALKIKSGEITFQNVQFKYKDTELLFANKTLTIRGGEKIGLVGHSGSGKTTFVNLILRIFDLDGGRILIDGQDISFVSQESLRQSIGIVPQDMPLFHRSLMENIRYGKINASDQEVIEASKKAHAHEFITNMPQGYDSLAGERGLKISGGQRQRIAIARAILKNASILIFDEATSALDNNTEKLIQESLSELMQNKTSIVIAHKLATLQKMDRILVFDHGKIVQEGSHQELLARAGYYKDMWESQVGSLLPETEIAEEADLGALN